MYTRYSTFTEPVVTNPKKERPKKAPFTKSSFRNGQRVNELFAASGQRIYGKNHFIVEKNLEKRRASTYPYWSSSGLS